MCEESNEGPVQVTCERAGERASERGRGRKKGEKGWEVKDTGSKGKRWGQGKWEGGGSRKKTGPEGTLKGVRRV